MNEEQLFQQYSTDRALQAKYPDFESYKQAVMSVGRNQNVFQTLAERGREYLQNVPEYLSGAGQRITGGLSDLYGGIKERFGFFPSPVGLLMAGIDKLDRFDDLPVADQQFITESMGQAKQGLGGFYRDPQSGLMKDPMGINVRSLFGNYGDYVTRQNVKRNLMPTQTYTSPNQLAYNAFIANQFARQQQLRQEQAAQSAAKAKQYTAPMQPTSGGNGGGKVGGGGFSTQGSPYGSGPGGIHDY